LDTFQVKKPARPEKAAKKPKQATYKEKINLVYSNSVKQPNGEFLTSHSCYDVFELLSFPNNEDKEEEKEDKKPAEPSPPVETSQEIQPKQQVAYDDVRQPGDVLTLENSQNFSFKAGTKRMHDSRSVSPHFLQRDGVKKAITFNRRDAAQSKNTIKDLSSSNEFNSLTQGIITTQLKPKIINRMEISNVSSRKHVQAHESVQLKSQLGLKSDVS
jgi:hypothetical protein